MFIVSHKTIIKLCYDRKYINNSKPNLFIIIIFYLKEDLLIHGDSVYDVIDKQDQQAVRTELSRAPTDGEDRVFLCRMNVARNARRQMRFGDQKVNIIV